MKKVGAAVLVLMPIALLCLLAIYRKRHPLSEPSAFASGGWPATTNQVAKTIREWNAVGSKDYVDASDRTRLGSVLTEVFQDQDLSQKQIEKAKETVIDLVESLVRGDYEMFIKARIPCDDYQISEAVAKGLRHYSSLGASATSLQHYRDIWVSSFKTNRLWSQILLNQTNAISLKKLTKSPSGRFEFPKYVGDNNIRIESYTTLAFDFRHLEEKEMKNSKQLLVCSIFFMGKEPVLDEARPFMLTFFWSNSINNWVPIDFVHAFIQNPAVKFRFF